MKIKLKKNMSFGFGWALPTLPPLTSRHCIILFKFLVYAHESFIHKFDHYPIRRPWKVIPFYTHANYLFCLLFLLHLTYALSDLISFIWPINARLC
jgi:hypothetical protein